jgi:hypothetical protein
MQIHLFLLLLQVAQMMRIMHLMKMASLISASPAVKWTSVEKQRGEAFREQQLNLH